MPVGYANCQHIDKSPMNCILTNGVFKIHYKLWFLSTSTSNIYSKAPRYCMFLDWYSKNALVIQLLIVLGVKEHSEGRGGGRVERVNKFLVPKKGGRERGAYLKVGLNRGYIRYILLALPYIPSTNVQSNLC